MYRSRFVPVPLLLAAHRYRKRNGTDTIAK
jgi:hypothetical protein